MYFASRLQVGRMLASQLAEKYQNEKCAVLALDDGGAMVGVQISAKLHCVLTLLLTSEISLPREPVALAGITPGGSLAYNHQYSQGELDELSSEYYGLIEQEKLTGMHDLNRRLGDGDTINKRLLQGCNIIIVSDGLKNGFLVELAAVFLKPLTIKKLIVATPFASVQAVDTMHILADELYCLNVVSDYIDTNHYYDKQDVPDHEIVLETVKKIVANWE